jgi:hypothetical protein
MNIFPELKLRRSKGLATEAARAILKFGLEKLNLDTIYAGCHMKMGPQKSPS